VRPGLKRLVQRTYRRTLGRVMLHTYLVLGPEERLWLHPSANVANATFNTVGGRIVIGEHTFFGHSVCVVTGTHDRHAPVDVRHQAVQRDGCDVEIGRGVWLASNVTVVGPCRIGDGAVVAAGAVVLSDVPARGFVGGVPARPLERPARLEVLRPRR
jgi:acetyltransferase-like isoleucine patch superfamily enzyme